jgi:aryl-alcohol dehydrogenase-like predicted oxidoreductase
MGTDTKKTPAERFHSLTQGLVRSEGWWRLSVSASLVGFVLWLPLADRILSASYISEAQLRQLSPCYARGDISCEAAQAIRNHADNLALAIALFALAIFIAVPWGIIQVIGWVVEGFGDKSN